jgi:predicted GIY-YIG superfamily endonuclease
MKEYNGIVNVSEPENDYSLYIMYSFDKSDNCIYVGVSKNPKQRIVKHNTERKRKVSSHKPLYIWLNDTIDNLGKKVAFEIIEERLSEKEAFEKEIQYVQKYKDEGYNILNISEGGRGYKGHTPWNKGKKGTYSEEHIEKLSISHKGQPGGMKDKRHSKETRELLSLRNKERKERGWINPRGKRVYKYTSDNKLLAEYNSLHHAAECENVSPSSVGEWCRKEKQPMNKFVYSYIKLN